MKVENVSGKIIVIGNTVLLPGETKELEANFENGAALDAQKTLGFVKVTGKASRTATVELGSEDADGENDEEQAEALRKSRLASLKNISEEDLAVLANQLGIRPETCKDTEDVLKKVKEALKK